MKSEEKAQFISEVCNLASQFLAANNVANLTTIVANIEVKRLELLKDYQEQTSNEEKPNKK